MEELNIKLTFIPDRFREMYYHNGKGHILTYKPTQKAIIYCLLIIVTILCIYFYSFKNPGISWLIVLAAIIFLFTGIYAIYEVLKYLKWKKDVEASVRENSKYELHHLKLTAAALELTQDATITIERWENIKSATIDDNHIMLFKLSGPAFIFPASSMKTDEFLKVKDFIVNKIIIPPKE